MTTAPATTTELTDEQRAYVEGLHDLATFLEARPELIPALGVHLCIVPGWSDDDDYDERADFARLVRLLGSGTKTATDAYFRVVRQFGPHQFAVAAERAVVCERVIVGTETVEVPDPDAVAALPKVTETREIVEWRCPDTILGATS